jgi:Type II secretion system (T2SS), protein N
MRRLVLALSVLIVIGVVAVCFLPASFAYRYLMKPSETVTLDDLSGTLWNGHAGSLVVHGQPLGQVDWHLHPLPLLQSHRNVDFVISGAGVDAQGNLDKTGAIAEFRDLTFKMPIQLAAQIAHASSSESLAGDVGGSLAHIRFQEGWPTDVQSGSIRWHGAATSRLTHENLGDIEATFASVADGAIAGTLHNAAGKLQLSGNFKVAANRDIELSDLAFHFAAELATPLIHVPDINPSGDIDGKITHVGLHGNLWPTALQNGNIRWNKAAISGATHADLGNLEVAFSSDADGNIIGATNDLGGPLQVDGTFKVTKEAYEAEMLLTARNGDAQIVEALHHVGTLQPNGSSILQTKGPLPSLFGK